MDNAADKPLTNGELTVKEDAQQHKTADETFLNGDLTTSTGEETSEKNDEFRIIRHLGGVQVASGSTAIFSVLTSGEVDEVHEKF